MHRASATAPASPALVGAYPAGADTSPSAAGSSHHLPLAAVPSAAPGDIYDEVAYAYDGTLEGLLSAIFAAYERHENPTDVVPESRLQPRLGQRVAAIPTNMSHAARVLRGVKRACGWRAAHAVKQASCSDEPDAGTAVYRFVRYAMDEQKHRNCERCRKRSSCPGRSGAGPCPKMRGRALSDITHPAVERLFRISRSISQECEHLRQFVRFQHLRGESEGDDTGTEVWFARVNPKASVVPLVMDHFVERLGVQPFIIYDEVHELAGVYDGGDWHLVATAGQGDLARALPDPTADEALFSEAWRTFYRSVSVDARYHPELRRQFMPKRFWKNLTELQESPAALLTARS